MAFGRCARDKSELEAALAAAVQAHAVLREAESRLRSYRAQRRRPVRPHAATLDEYCAWQKATAADEDVEARGRQAVDVAKVELEAAARRLASLMPPYVWLRSGDQAVMYLPRRDGSAVRLQLRFVRWREVRRRR